MAVICNKIIYWRYLYYVCKSFVLNVGHVVFITSTAHVHLGAATKIQTILKRYTINTVILPYFYLKNTFSFRRIELSSITSLQYLN